MTGEIQADRLQQTVYSPEKEFEWPAEIAGRLILRRAFGGSHEEKHFSVGDDRGFGRFRLRTIDGGGPGDDFV